jgi:hypothetical protein
VLKVFRSQQQEMKTLVKRAADDKRRQNEATSVNQQLRQIFNNSNSIDDRFQTNKCHA